MKGLFLLLTGAGLFVATAINAQEQNAGSFRKNALGVRISSADAAVNQAISYRYFFKANTAFEGLFSFRNPTALGVLVEKFKPFNPSGLSWFWGAGAYVGFSGNRNFGAQGIVGLDFTAPSLPLNLSVDWKPELNVTKEFSFEPAAVGLSARFIF